MTKEYLPIGEKKGKFHRFNSKKELDDRFMEHYDLFERYRQNKEQHIRFFNKDGVSRTINDYVRDSVDRMNEYHLKPSHKDDWQNNMFDPVTRNKLISILAIIAGSRLKLDLVIKPKSIFTKMKTKVRRDVIADLLESANDHNNLLMETVWEMYTAMSEGTVIGFEGWRQGEREVEYVKSFNPDTGEKETEKVRSDLWDDVYGCIVPTEEFFPENIWVNSFRKDVQRCFWVREMSFAGFQTEFGAYPNADKVRPASYFIKQDDFEWGISENVYSDNVEIMQYYDEVDDKLGMWANGVEIYYGCLPWNHKRLPFWVSQFEPIHHQFLYGKSLPDKLMGMQDVNNAILNNILDQLYISLNSPIFVDGDFDLEDGFLEPKRIYNLEPGSRVQKGQLGSVDPTSFQVLSLLRKSMEESSISAQAQGVPSGGRKTKFEVQQLTEGAMQLASLFLQLYESAFRDKMLLRTPNVLQYYSMARPERDKDERYRYIEIDTQLSNGQKGTRKIQVVESKGDIPGKADQIKMIEEETGKPFNAAETNVQPVFITKDWLLHRGYEMEFKVVANSSVKDSEVQRRNNDMAFYQIANGDPRYNQEKLAEDLVDAFGKDESVLSKQGKVAGAAQQAPGIPGMPGMRGQPAGGQPPAQPAQPEIDLDLL